jgi:NADH-quinone oxidoreductase subunit H
VGAHDGAGRVLVAYVVTLVVIPFSPEIFALNLDVGIFLVVAVSSITVIGTLMAGWASAKQVLLIGALRSAAQLIAFDRRRDHGRLFPRC